MMSRRSVLYGLGAIGLGSATFVGIQDPDPTPDENANTDLNSDAESNVESDWDPAVTAELTHQYVNDTRAQHDHTQLSWHGGLADVAREYATTMGEESFFSHQHDGRNGGDRLDQAGVDVETWGENIIYTWWDRELEDGGVLSTPSEVASWCTNWWLNSPEHRANIMDAQFEAHAVGFYRTDAGKILGVELFGN